MACFWQVIQIPVSPYAYLCTFVSRCFSRKSPKNAVKRKIRYQYQNLRKRCSGLLQERAFCVPNHPFTYERLVKGSADDCGNGRKRRDVLLELLLVSDTSILKYLIIRYLEARGVEPLFPTPLRPARSRKGFIREDSESFV